MAAVREALDCNTEFVGPLAPQTLARAVVELCASFAKPVLPGESLPTAEVDSMSIKLLCRRLIDGLPTPNYNIFIYVLSFYREVLAEGDFNRFLIEMFALNLSFDLCFQCCRSTVSKMVDICITSFMASSTDKSITEGERALRICREQAMRPVFLYLLTTDAI